MRVAIFSDVHSNLDALQTVLAEYEQLDIDMYVCLGDVVGYGAKPHECCEIVRDLVEHCVLGNHDAAVAGRMDYGYYYDAARIALDHHTSLLSEENLEWLRGLPYSVDWGDYCFSHGSPVDEESFNYVFNPTQAFALLPHYDDLQHVTFIGHSHLTKSFALYGDGEARVEDVTSDRLEFEEGRKYIVTVGSVGQPRDNDARACFTVLDSEERVLEFHRVDYDICTAVGRILECDKLVPDFGKRLFLGI